MTAKWKSALISPDTSIQEALARIDSAATHIALVVDADQRLLGTLSDGDVRRALLAGMTLGDSIRYCMCTTPTTVKADESRESVLGKMRQLVLHQIPALDDQGRVIDLKIIDDLLVPEHQEHWVVIMAGGLGSRLKELTRDTPKPMLPVGNKPILETIVSRFVEQGYRNIWLAVNYHADQIEKHFDDGAKFGAHIRYLREDIRLGTAGALGLLPIPDAPILVSNADLLTKANYTELLRGHIASNAAATMAVREHEFRIPYGVVHTQNGIIEGLVEKPIHRVTVNAGIYALSPEAVVRIPQNTFFDMPELFSKLMKDGLVARCHCIDDYWLDIGHHEDLKRAHIDFPDIF